MERLLLEAGLPPEAVFVVVQHSPWNKYARDGRPPEQLWAEVYKASTEKGVQEIQTNKLKWYSFNDLLLYNEKPEWLVEDVWMQKNVGWIAGDGKSYKSVITLELALSIASGLPFLGQYRVLDPGPVLMIMEEDPRWRIARRLQAMAQKKELTSLSVMEKDEYLGISLSSVKQIPIHVAISSGFSFTDHDYTDELEVAIQQTKPKMIIFDPMFMMVEGIDEFKASEIAAVLKLVKRWRDLHNCAVAIVHHNNKGDGQAHKRLYGSMALYAWSENNLFFTRQKGSNLVVIERDIKDAMAAPKISLEIQDIGHTWSYQLKEVEEGGKLPTTAEQKVTAYLLTCGVGTTVSKSDIAQSTGVSDKTVGQILDKLYVQGLVELEKKGKGGKLFAIPLPKLKAEGSPFTL